MRSKARSQGASQGDCFIARRGGPEDRKEPSFGKAVGVLMAVEISPYSGSGGCVYRLKNGRCGKRGTKVVGSRSSFGSLGGSVYCDVHARKAAAQRKGSEEAWGKRLFR